MEHYDHYFMVVPCGFVNWTDAEMNDAAMMIKGSQEEGRDGKSHGRDGWCLDALVRGPGYSDCRAVGCENCMGNLDWWYEIGTDAEVSLVFSAENLEMYEQGETK